MYYALFILRVRQKSYIRFGSEESAAKYYAAFKIISLYVSNNIIFSLKIVSFTAFIFHFNSVNNKCMKFNNVYIKLFMDSRQYIEK